MSRARALVLAAGTLLALVLGGFLAADRLARSAVESALGRALGTETTLETMDVGLLSGEATMEGLRVANPEGFDAPHFLVLRRGRLAVGLRSLLADTVDVRQVTLEGMELTLVQSGTKSNVAPILASVREARARRAPEDETRFRIDEVLIRDVTARVRLGTGLGDAAAATVEIPEIRLADVGAGRGGPIALSELAGVIVQAVLRAVGRESGGLPGALRGLLRDQVGPLPGGLELRLPEGGRDRSLREEAEETLKELVPGQDDGG